MTMIVVGLFAALVLLLLLLVVRGNDRPVRDTAEAWERTSAVDLESFRNLISVAERDYLQSRLPAHMFRKVQRARLLATAGYLWRVAHNAAILMRLGEAAQTSGDSQLARAATELASLAVATRIYTILALLQVAFGFLFPSWSISFGSVVDRYERLTFSFGTLRILWRPPVAQV